VFLYLILIAVTLTCVLPFMHVLSKALSAEPAVIANRVFIWPLVAGSEAGTYSFGVTFGAYAKVFADASILRSLWITAVVTVLFTLLGMVITTCLAYALSRRQMAGRKTLTFLCMFTMYFGGGIIPEYLLVNNLGLLDTIWSLVLPLAFSAYNFLIMKNVMASSVPVSLEESARIDGAGHFRILFHIFLPLSKPILATLSLFYAVGRWNTYQDALFYIKQRVDLRPLQLKLYYLIVQASESFQLEATSVSLTNPEILKAACVMFATIPILCVYPFLQKYFVQGTMIGAVKE
jgi:putative aldouronate transport system permease protein